MRFSVLAWGIALALFSHEAMAKTGACKKLLKAKAAYSHPLGMEIRYHADGHNYLSMGFVPNSPAIFLRSRGEIISEMPSLFAFLEAEDSGASKKAITWNFEKGEYVPAIETSAPQLYDVTDSTGYMKADDPMRSPPLIWIGGLGASSDFTRSILDPLGFTELDTCPLPSSIYRPRVIRNGHLIYYETVNMPPGTTLSTNRSASGRLNFVRLPADGPEANSVVFLDPYDLKELRRFDIHGKVVWINGDDRSPFVVIHTTQGAWVANITTGAAELITMDRYNSHSAFSPDHKLVAIGTYSTLVEGACFTQIDIVSLSDLRIVYTILEKGQNNLHAPLQFLKTDDGYTLSTSILDETQLWRFGGSIGKPIKTAEVTFSRSLKMVDGTTESGLKMQYTAPFPTGWQQRWSPDSRFLALALRDGTVVVLSRDLVPLAALSGLKVTGPGNTLTEPKDIQFSPDGKYVASLVDRQVLVWPDVWSQAAAQILPSTSPTEWVISGTEKISWARNAEGVAQAIFSQNE